jgi:hypothetical protein
LQVVGRLDIFRPGFMTREFKEQEGLVMPHGSHKACNCRRYESEYQKRCGGPFIPKSQDLEYNTQDSGSLWYLIKGHRVK